MHVIKNFSTLYCASLSVNVLDYPFFSIIPKTRFLHLPWKIEDVLEYETALHTFSLTPVTTRDVYSHGYYTKCYSKCVPVYAMKADVRVEVRIHSLLSSVV
jgi:hypothetical protein